MTAADILGSATPEQAAERISAALEEIAKEERRKVLAMVRERAEHWRAEAARDADKAQYFSAMELALLEIVRSLEMSLA